jgi:hypothetical protein
MRIKIVTLDCAATIARVLGRAGMSESALSQRLHNRGFNAADMRAALTAMIVGGKLLRYARPTGKPGPTPHHIYWRETKENDE